jgi:hypothetical protein
MRASKGSHRIAVGEVEYRWRATGNDGYICISIWPTSNIGPYLGGNLRYHEGWIDDDGSWGSGGNQLVVTNRIIRRIIEYAISEYNYDPTVKGKELHLNALDEAIEWKDAVRGNRY